MAVHECFDLKEIRKFNSKKIAEKNDTDKKIITLIKRGFIKTSVFPNSLNHHQSVTRLIIEEKKNKKTKNIKIPDRKRIFL